MTPTGVQQRTKPGWRFGVFEVDARRGELRRSGVPLKLREQSFQILVALLENPGEIVTRDELRHLLWPSDTFVDFDHSLNTAMMKLRDALGDSAEAPIYIETIPKRGYQFVAPVVTVGDQISVLAPSVANTGTAQDANQRSLIQPPSGAGPPAIRSSRAWVALIALSALFGLAGGGYLLVHLRQTPLEVKTNANFHIVPITSAPGLNIAPAISPDGRMVAYFWDGPERNRYELYVKLIGAEKPTRITYEGGRMGGTSWSPDGDRIAFTRCDIKSGQGSVIVVPALGGLEHKITDAACPFNYPSPLAWSTFDGGRLVFIDRCAANGPLGLVVFSLATGKRECLTDAAAPGFEHWPAFSLSPDGTQIAFNPSVRGGCDIYIMPVAGGTPRQIVHEEPSCASLMWTPDGAIVFSSARTTTESLWRVPVSGGEIRKESLYPATIGNFSHDGRRFAYEEFSRTEVSSVWRADLSRPGGAVLANRKLITTQSGETEAQPSPDGTRIAWQSSRTGPAEIWIGDASGDAQRQLTHLNSYAGSARWSPDGRWIAFDFDRGSLQIFAIDAEGRNLHQITSGTGVNVVPSWSRDGKWIYFASERTGRTEIWKRSLESGTESQVTTNGGFCAFESFDGKTVYFSKFDKAGIWSIPSQGGSETIVLEGKPQTLFWGSWGLTQTGIYYMNVESEPRASIEYYDFATRRTHPILALDKLPGWGGPSLSSTSDGRTIYYGQHDLQSVVNMMEFAQ